MPGASYKEATPAGAFPGSLTITLENPDVNHDLTRALITFTHALRTSRMSPEHQARDDAEMIAALQSTKQQINELREASDGVD